MGAPVPFPSSFARGAHVASAVGSFLLPAAAVMRALCPPFLVLVASGAAVRGGRTRGCRGKRGVTMCVWGLWPGPRTARPLPRCPRCPPPPPLPNAFAGRAVERLRCWPCPSHLLPSWCCDPCVQPGGQGVGGGPARRVGSGGEGVVWAPGASAGWAPLGVRAGRCPSAWFPAPPSPHPRAKQPSTL